jgi:hypothetical protein
VTSVRVFRNSGYQDLESTFVLERPPGGAPVLKVMSAYRVQGRWRRNVITAALDEGRWSTLLDEARMAMRDWQALEVQRATPAPPEAGVADLMVCDDAGEDIVEIAQAGQVSRAAEAICEFTELDDLAADLAKTAMALTPDCRSFAPDAMNDEFGVLAGCLLAHGDRRAALEVLTLMENAYPHPRAETWLADPAIVAHWPGRPGVHGAAAFRRLWAHITPGAQPSFHPVSATGAAHDTVVLRGRLLAPPHTFTPSPHADCVEIWRRTRAGWRLVQIEVGHIHPPSPFRRTDPDD